MSRDLRDLLASDENVIHETRQHWWVVVRSIGVLVPVLAVIALAAWYVEDQGWRDRTAGDVLWYALLVALVAIGAVILWRLLVWVTERFYVTTNRIVYAHGVLNRNVTTTPLVKIDEITVHRPLVGRMLGFGRLDVENAAGGTEPLAGLEFLPRPMKLFRMISERARHQRMVEGGAHRDEDADGLVDTSRRSPAESSASPGQAGSAEADALRQGLGSWKPASDQDADAGRE